MEANVYFAASKLEILRPYTILLLDACECAIPFETLKQHNLAGFGDQRGALLYSELADSATRHIPELREICVPYYREKSELILQTSHPDAYEISQKFACVSFVIDYLSVTDCLNQNSGFIDGAAPEKTYFYLYVKNLAYKLGINLPRLKKMMYANIWVIRDEPALNEQILVNLHNILEYVIQVLKDIVSSMIMGVSFVPNEGEYHALFAGLECPGSPGYEHTQEADELELSLFSKLVEEAGEQKVNENVDPNKALAEHYAHANGYVDFKAAFDTLGHEALYTTTSDYCINAKTKIGFQTEEAAENKRRRPYDLLK